MRRKLTVTLTAVLVLFSAAFSADARLFEGSRPNIILILADDLGYGDVGCYGAVKVQTPNIDRLAAQAMRFTDAHSPSAVCSPTRYAVLTGTDPFRRYHTSHVLFNAEPLVIQEGEATVASLLKEKGYHTGVIGKWHLGLGDRLPRDLHHPGRGPNDIGFDYSYLVPDGHNMDPRYYLENGRVEGGIKRPYESNVKILDRVGYKLLRHVPVGTWANRRPDHEIGNRLADKADEFIERHKDQPFFLYYPTCSIHGPQKPDPRFVGKSGIGPHGDFVLEFDWAVGRIMHTLERLGLDENTQLIVTSDNGGYRERKPSGHRPTHPWKGFKDSAWEGGHRVPFLARWPGSIAAGTVSDETISLVDLTATLAAVAGVTLPAEAAFDSFNLLPTLLGHTGGTPIRSYTVTVSRGMQEVALRQGNWKLILAPESNDARLYDLAKDPGENHDLAPSRPSKVAKLRNLLNGYFESGSSRPGAKANGKTIDELFGERDERNRLILARFGGKE
jgi:arylsulfatase A-like enzyme